MDTLGVVHPKAFKIEGYTIRVRAAFTLTARQAQVLAMHACRSLMARRKKKGSYEIPFAGDQAQADLLG